MDSFKDKSNPLGIPKDTSTFVVEIVLTAFGILAVLLLFHGIGYRQNNYLKIIMDSMIYPLLKFFRDSGRLMNRCTKPSRKEFVKVSTATAIGFCIMGFIGFAVKLIHIPINNILVS